MSVASKAMARPTHRWVFFLVLIAFLSGCHHYSEPSSRAAYEALRLKLQRGDLLAAQLGAEQEIEHYVKTSPEWAGRFRVLEAETLLWRGLGSNAFALLDAELPPSLAVDEAAVRR